MIRREEPIHKAIVQYLKATLPHGFIVQHTPNKPRSKVSGAIEKSMGALAGWPDIAVYGMSQGYHPMPTAWFFEVKAPKGRVSEAQHEVHDRLNDLGFFVAIVHSIDDVRDAVQRFGIPTKDAAINDNADPWVSLGDAAQSVVSGLVQRGRQ